MINRAIVETVKRAYGYGNDRARLLEFKAEAQDWETTKEMIRAIRTYNEFGPETVIASLTAIREAFPDERNYIEVGRESSPVIYLTFFGTSIDKIGEDFIRGQFAIASADEVSIEPKPFVKVRAWWD